MSIVEICVGIQNIKIRYCQDTIKRSVRKYRVRMSGISEL